MRIAWLPALVLLVACGHHESPGPSYVDRVDALCDSLLSGIEALPDGGSLDVSARRYLADWPAHQQLLDTFDAAVARLPVDPKATVLAAYVRWADGLDDARLTAARAGEQAWRAEVAGEITAEHAAGFADSCDAR